MVCTYNSFYVAPGDAWFAWFLFTVLAGGSYFAYFWFGADAIRYLRP